MKRYHQTIEQLCSMLSPIPVSWKDDHARNVLALLSQLELIHSWFDCANANNNMKICVNALQNERPCFN